MPGDRPPESGEKGLNSKMPLKEMLFLADQAAEAGLKVYPGKAWGMHYPSGGSVRREKLEGLLEGRYTAGEVLNDIKPDAIIYDLKELVDEGVDSVNARVRDYSSTVAYYDYERFARFVESMQGTGMDLDSVQKMYEGVARSRIRKKIYDAYGQTGRRQLAKSLQEEAARSVKNIVDLSSLNRVMEALKITWLAEDMRLIPSGERDKAVKALSAEESESYKALLKSYKRYAQNGDKSAYDELVEAVKEHMGGQKEEQEGEKPGQQEQLGQPEQQSDEAQKLMEQLQEFMDESVPPGMKGDPSIPEEDKDEYETPPPGKEQPKGDKESAEKQETVFFTITPSGSSKFPMTGDYCKGHKSYYDVPRKTWSKRKRLVSYTNGLKGNERQTIAGRTSAGIKAIPLPNGYALDFTSLSADAPAKILRDQNGCFYIQTDGVCNFLIDFLKEAQSFHCPPIAEDLQHLYTGSLSSETEAMIASLAGTPLQKAKQAQKHILDHHAYPAGGNLQAAGALQFKLREAPADKYIQGLDQSEYLECYSANTLFVAMVRKAGVQARLVVGHKVEGAVEGKALITDQTGHAWSEIWDGSAWRRVDATPRARKKDKSPEDREDEKKKQEKKTAGQKADDGGVEPPPGPKEEGEGEEGGESVEGGEEGESDEGGESGESGESGGEGGESGESGGESGEAGESGESGGESSGEEGEGGGSETGGQGGGEQGGGDLTEDVKSRIADQEKNIAESDLPEEAGDAEMQEGKEQMEQVREKMEEMEKKKRELKDKTAQAESFKELDKIEKELEKEDLIEQFKEEIEKQIKAQEEKMKKEIKDQAENMTEDGFMDEKQKDQILDELEKSLDPSRLDELARQVEQDNHLYNAYEEIKEEIMPMVDEWYEYFVEKLPRQEDIEVDEDSRTRRGIFDRKAVMRPRNLLFGTIKNPRVIRPSIKPKFLASIMLDVSGSMQGEKLLMARKLLVFYCELFTRISKEFGYIRFSIDTFSDGVTGIKNYDHDYDSTERYDFGGRADTIKARLMKAVTPSGGTNMLDAIQKAAVDLNRETADYPDYASALYFVGDGGDGYGNQANIRNFLSINDAKHGFGDHMYSAIMLGDKTQKQVLADIFGEEHTTVAPDFDSLIKESMEKFDGDIEFYLSGKFQ